jgi:hypothetical protein
VLDKLPLRLLRLPVRELIILPITADIIEITPPPELLELTNIEIEELDELEILDSDEELDDGAKALGLDEESDDKLDDDKTGTLLIVTGAVEENWTTELLDELLDEEITI